MTNSDAEATGIVRYGLWVLDPDTYVLRFEDDGYEYEVDIEDCLTSAQTLDWIVQVARKSWATDEIVGALVRGLNDILVLQSTLCPSGKSKRLSRAKVRDFVGDTVYGYFPGDPA